METALIVIVILQALTLGLMLWALVRASKKNRELEELLRPILDIASRMKSPASVGGVSVMKTALKALVTQIEKVPEPSPAVDAPQTGTRKLGDLAEDPAVRETVDNAARMLKSLFRKPSDAADGNE